jgi:hypothetical protein
MTDPISLTPKWALKLEEALSLNGFTYEDIELLCTGANLTRYKHFVNKTRVPNAELNKNLLITYAFTPEVALSHGCRESLSRLVRGLVQGEPGFREHAGRFETLGDLTKFSRSYFAGLDKWGERTAAFVEVVLVEHGLDFGSS